jgi:transcriptional regulator GlxA family with amidase domain
LESLDEGVKVIRDVRVVKDGVFSSGGVSAGIDMAFTLVEEICGPSVANETAHYIEYLRRQRRHEDRHADLYRSLTRTK